MCSSSQEDETVRPEVETFHQELKGMLCDTHFFLFSCFYFSLFPYGIKKGGGGFKPLSPFSLLMSLYLSMHKLVMGFWSLTCRKFSVRVSVRGY